MIRSRAKEPGGWQPQGRKALGMVGLSMHATIPKLRLRLPPELTTLGVSVRAEH